MSRFKDTNISTQHGLQGEVLPAGAGVHRDTPLVYAKAPINGILFQRLYLDVTLRAWRAFNDLAKEYDRSYEIHTDLVQSKENYERALHRFRHLPLMLVADTERIKLELREEVMVIAREAEAAELDHEIAMEEKRRKLAKMRGDKKADKKFHAIRRKTGEFKEKFDQHMAEAELLESKNLLKEIRQGAQTMAGEMAKESMSSTKIFEQTIISGKDNLIADYTAERGGEEKLSDDDHQFITAVENMAAYLKNKPPED